MSRVSTPLEGGSYGDDVVPKKLKIATKKHVGLPPERIARGIHAGFESFFATPATPIKVKPPFEPLGPKEHHHQTRRRIPEKVYEDLGPRGRKVLKPVDRPSPRERGMRHVPPYDPDELVQDTMQSKSRVYDPKTGELMIARQSSEWEFKDMYGRTRMYGPKRQFSHGFFPAAHNYPPSRDEHGRPIDFSLKQYGGPFCSRPIRTVEVEAEPNPELSAPAVLKNSAAQRAQHAKLLRQLQADAEAARLARSRTSTPSFSTSFSTSTAPPHPSHVGATASGYSSRLPSSHSCRSLQSSVSAGNLPRLSTSRAGRSTPTDRGSTAYSTSRLSTSTSLSSWQDINRSKDAHISALRAQVEALKRSR